MTRSFNQLSFLLIVALTSTPLTCAEEATKQGKIAPEKTEHLMDLAEQAYTKLDAMSKQAEKITDDAQDSEEREIADLEAVAPAVLVDQASPQLTASQVADQLNGDGVYWTRYRDAVAQGSTHEDAHEHACHGGSADGCNSSLTDASTGACAAGTGSTGCCTANAESIHAELTEWTRAKTRALTKLQCAIGHNTRTDCAGESGAKHEMRQDLHTRIIDKEVTVTNWIADIKAKADAVASLVSLTTPSLVSENIPDLSSLIETVDGTSVTKGTKMAFSTFSGESSRALLSERSTVSEVACTGACATTHSEAHVEFKAFARANVQAKLDETAAVGEKDSKPKYPKCTSDFATRELAQALSARLTTLDTQVKLVTKRAHNLGCLIVRAEKRFGVHSGYSCATVNGQKVASRTDAAKTATANHARSDGQKADGTASSSLLSDLDENKPDTVSSLVVSDKGKFVSQNQLHGGYLDSSGKLMRRHDQLPADSEDQ